MTIVVMYLLAIPALGIWIARRPMTDLDRRLAVIDAELSTR
jgi:hypothetical protein